MSTIKGVPTAAGGTGTQSHKDALSLSFNLTEADVELDEGTKEAPKREIVLTLLREGKGNPRDKRYYKRSCVEGVEGLLYARRKLFFNHLAEGAAPASDDVRNWCATLTKTWVVEDNGMLVRKGRMKIHDEWLWERCKDPVAREELAVSIEGRGAGKAEVIDGEKYTCIESIYWLNAFKFVPYPGNATMGADVVESDKNLPITEEHMDWTKLTLKDLQEHCPAIVEEITKAAAAKVRAELSEGAKGDGEKMIASLREEFKAQLDERTKNLTSTIEGLKGELEKSQKLLDASEVREKLREKDAVIERCLAEAKLPAEALTERFKARLKAVTERQVDDGKGGKKTVTVEEQVKAEIEEQKTLVTPKLGETAGKKVGESKGAPSKVSAADYKDLNEGEKQFLFEKVVMGMHDGKSLEDFREEMAAAGGKGKKGKKKADAEDDDNDEDDDKK